MKQPLLTSTVALLLITVASQSVAAESGSRSGPVATLFGKAVAATEVAPTDAAVKAATEPGKKPAEVRAQLMAESLERKIFSALLDSFVEENSIKVSDEEIEAAAEALTSEVPAEERPAKEQWREIYEDVVMSWKTSKALYEKYGGTVIFQQMNPLEPVGAYRKLIEEGERNGSFKVLDPSLKPHMWKYFTREDHPFQLSKDDIDFTTPWWLKKQKADEVEQEDGAK